MAVWRIVAARSSCTTDISINLNHSCISGTVHLIIICIKTIFKVSKLKFVLPITLHTHLHGTCWKLKCISRRTRGSTDSLIFTSSLCVLAQEKFKIVFCFEHSVMQGLLMQSSLMVQKLLGSVKQCGNVSFDLSNIWKALRTPVFFCSEQLRLILRYRIVV